VKLLLVGDPHIKTSNLDEAKKLSAFIYNTAITSNPDSIVFLGDLFHTHAVKRIEVETFWMETFDKLNTLNIPIISLVGNHDQIGTKEKEGFNSLNVFENKWSHVTIVNKPMILNDIAYAPYTRNYTELISNCEKLYNQGAKELLIAHQTFTGAVYDNGFYAEDGLDLTLIPQKQIISGHIHSSQHINKCFYPGTPKWDTMSDANKEKGLCLFEFNECGQYHIELIPTNNIVTPIIKIIVHEGDEEPTLNPNARNYLEFHGKTSWINKMKKKYKNKASIKGVPKDRKMSVISNGELMQFTSFLQTYFEPMEGVTKTQINDFLRGLDARL